MLNLSLTKSEGIAMRGSLSTQRGFTLIELMIGIVLTLLATFIIFKTFEVSEARKRASTGAADAQQTGTLMTYGMSRIVRQAGAGLVTTQNLFGCDLKVTRNNAALWPGTTLAAPFDVVTNLRLAPVSVYPGAGSAADVLVTMGSAGEGGGDVFFSENAISNYAGSVATVTTPAYQFKTNNSGGLRKNDLVLIKKITAVDSRGGDCFISQVHPGASETYITSNAAGAIVAEKEIPLSAPSIGTVVAPNFGRSLADLSALDGDATLVGLGNRPVFYGFGVNSSGQLVQSDLLGIRATDAFPVAENVYTMKILFGTKNPTTNTLDSWVRPGAAGWSNADLSPIAVTQASQNLTDQIVALRIAVVARTSEVVGGEELGPAAITLFNDEPTANQISLSFTDAERRYRYQVYDVVVPIRNARYIKRT